MEREAVEHLLGRTRTDARLDGLAVQIATEDAASLEVIMLSDGTADMISIGSSGARGIGRGHDEYPRE
jgi:hypothetical protein